MLALETKLLFQPSTIQAVPDQDGAAITDIRAVNPVAYDCHDQCGCPVKKPATSQHKKKV